MIPLHEGTFNNIQNNQIGIVSNNKLRKDISRFYDFYAKTIIQLENEKPEYEPYSSKKIFFQAYFKLSESSYKLGDRQSASGGFNNPKIEKFALEFNDISGAKNDNAFKIELNESISIRQVKIETYLHLLKLIKELNELVDEELTILKN